MLIAAESHVSYTFMTLMVEAGDCSTTEKKKQATKQVSKVIKKISEAETNVLIMSLTG